MESALEIRPVRISEQPGSLPPLAVDLDGTLLKTDVLLESLIRLLRRAPWSIFLLPFWLWKGKAHLKHQVACRVSIDVSTLPYREDLLDYLRTQRSQGRVLALATAADQKIAHQIADHLRLFDFVFSSDGNTNLLPKAKRDRLVKVFGERGFDYAGNGRHDLRVWSAARRAIAVNPDFHIREGIARAAELDRVFEDPRKSLTAYLRPLRPQHWLKNILLFVTLLAAHRVNELLLLNKLVLAFLAFGCIASSGYLINDLFDLQADRRHPDKRFRAFASGSLPLVYPLVMIPLLAGFGCVLGEVVSGPFLVTLLTYFALSVAYSLFLKKVVVLDVSILAGLYTLRILAGSAAISIWPSHWLLAFSIFLFFSLALVKRYSELTLMRQAEGDGARARGYDVRDGELLSAMGIASGYLAVFVLAMYMSSAAAHVLYRRYEMMWFLCPLLFYWISYAWLIAHRGRMPDDPVVFAMNDRTSRILAVLMLVVMLLAL